VYISVRTIFIPEIRNGFRVSCSVDLCVCVCYVHVSVSTFLSVITPVSLPLHVSRPNENRSEILPTNNPISIVLAVSNQSEYTVM